jgi:type IV pilus assembly protein PilM
LEGGSLLSRRGAVTGIDVGHQAIKLVRLANGGTAPLTLTHWGVEELPPDREPTPQVQAEALRRLLNRLHLRPRHLGRVAAAVGGADVHLRQVALPRLPFEDLRKALPYEARKHLPLEGMNHPAVDCQVLNGIPRRDPDSETQDVLLVATSRETRNRLLQTLGEAGIDPEVLDAQPLPAVNAILDGTPDAEDGWVIVLDVGAGSTTLAAVLPDGSFYSRSLEFTGGSLTRSLERALGIERPEAEILKRELQKSADEGGSVVRDHLRGLTSGVIETVRFLGVRRRQSPVSRIYLCGGGTLLAGLREQLAAALHVPVEYPDPFRDLPVSGRRPEETEIPWLVGALGLARWWD